MKPRNLPKNNRRNRDGNRGNRHVFVGHQFYIRDPDDTVMEFTEWDGTSRLD